MGHCFNELNTEYQPPEQNDAVCAHDSLTELSNGRYCIQATVLIPEKDVNIKKIKQIIQKSGNCSLAMVRNNSLRFHIHSNNPQDIFAQVMDYSSVKDIKIDDMKLQNLARGKKGQVAILTDSAADIPEDIKEKYIPFWKLERGRPTVLRSSPPRS